MFIVILVINQYTSNLVDFNTFVGNIIIQWGCFKRSGGNITDIKTYTSTFPISFPTTCWTGTCTTGTANAVVGAQFGLSDGSKLEWSIKPNHSSTANTNCFFIAIGN